MLNVELGRCREIAYGDPIKKSWHLPQCGSFDSAFSAGCPCKPTCQKRCSKANGILEEYCVRDASRISVVDAILVRTDQANRAGYFIRERRLIKDMAREGEWVSEQGLL